MELDSKLILREYFEDFESYASTLYLVNHLNKLLKLKNCYILGFDGFSMPEYEMFFGENEFKIARVLNESMHEVIVGCTRDDLGRVYYTREEADEYLDTIYWVKGKHVNKLVEAS